MPKTNKPIKLFYISDLHLEMLMTDQGINSTSLANYALLFTQQPLSDDHTNILVVAGDLIYSKHLHYLSDWVKNTFLRFDRTFIILGNHDYWKSNFKQALEQYKTFFHDPIFNGKIEVLENDTVELNDQYHLFGATLWYKVPVVEQYSISNIMNDYKKIRNNDYSRVKYWDFEQRHFESLQKMHLAAKATYEQGKKLVVATHHATSELYMPFTSYKDCLGYAVTLPDAVLHYDQQQLDYDLANTIVGFIHGHSHVDKPLFYKNEYGMSTYMNTLGYLGHECFFTYDPKHKILPEAGMRIISLNTDNGEIIPSITLD